jgi:hypothetical protein
MTLKILPLEKGDLEGFLVCAFNFEIYSNKTWRILWKK